MNFYLPPLSPILHLAKGDEGGTYDPESAEFFNDIDKMRIPIKFLANLIGAGNESLVMESLKKQMAVRIYRRNKRIGDVGDAKVKAVLADAGLTEEECEEIFKLVALATYQERFVIPEVHRESKTSVDPRTVYEKRGTIGFGAKRVEWPRRQW